MANGSRSSIENKIKEIISERLEIKTELIKPESRLRDDLGIDSFGLVELSFEIKDKFGLKVEEQDLKSIVKVKDIVAYIFNKTKES